MGFALFEDLTGFALFEDLKKLNYYIYGFCRIFAEIVRKQVAARLT